MGTGPLTDGALALAHLGGDAEAFAVLYHRYYPRLVRAVDRRVRNHALAEDIAQDAMVQAMVRLWQYDPARPFLPWVRQIALHLAAQHARRRANEVCVADLPAPGAQADDTDMVAARAALAACLARLPVRQRQALLLRYVEDRDLAEVAESLGAALGATTQLLFRARKALAREWAAMHATYGAIVAPLVVAPARVRRWLMSLPTRWVTANRDLLPRLGEVVLGLTIVYGTIAAPVPMHGALPTVRPPVTSPVAPAPRHPAIPALAPPLGAGAVGTTLRHLPPIAPPHLRDGSDGDVIHTSKPLTQRVIDMTKQAEAMVQQAVPGPPCAANGCVTVPHVQH
jgi:RNA polymerase sigma-70 factor (ECF subfamily)